MSYKDTPYYGTGRATDLVGADRALYRFFEMLPGLLSWGTIILSVVLSYYLPKYGAFFIIAFNLYWVLKTSYLSLHLRQNWKRLRANIKTDYAERIAALPPARELWHLVLLPFYKESENTVEKSLNSLLSSAVYPAKLIIVLATEARAGENAARIAASVSAKYGSRFGHFLVTSHAEGIRGEMAGKGSNIAYAAREAQRLILDAHNIPYDKVIVSAFDIDTVVYPQYFASLTWHFLNAPDPYRTSYQPVPLYNNNIWQAPALSRVVATSASFWQMIQQERPERLTTFSSHSISFKALHELGFWQKNLVSEDSRIFWNAFFCFDGNYYVTPISYPVSMDANLAESTWKTLINVYKQQRRWAWGVENVPYILMGFVKNKRVALGKKIKISFIELERAWSLATNPLLLFLLSWLPVILGGREFNATILSYNLPTISKYLSFLGMAGLLLSAIISLTFLPPPPQNYSAWHKKIVMFAQWLFIPFTLIFFGSIPALDAQTRLLFGKYMGFWVTPKHEITDAK